MRQVGGRQEAGRRRQDQPCQETRRRRRRLLIEFAPVARKSAGQASGAFRFEAPWQPVAPVPRGTANSQPLSTRPVAEPGHALSLAGAARAPVCRWRLECACRIPFPWHDASLASSISVAIVAVAVMLATQLRSASAEEVGQGRLRGKGRPRPGARRGHGLARGRSRRRWPRSSTRPSRRARPCDAGSPAAGFRRRIRRRRRARDRRAASHQQFDELMTAVATGTSAARCACSSTCRDASPSLPSPAPGCSTRCRASDPNTSASSTLNRPRWEQLIDKYFVPAGISETWISD